MNAIISLAPLPHRQNIQGIMGNVQLMDIDLTAVLSRPEWAEL